MTFVRLAAAAAFSILPAFPALAQPRNVVIFIADGLRYDSVTAESAPTMYRVKKQGVDFANSHAMYPTVTTANASAIATGHYLGDTGDYGNTLFTDFPVPCRLGATVTFLEDDCILRDMKDHFGSGYLGQTTLLKTAHASGYNTAILGKKGPAAIQDIAALDSKDARVDDPLGIFVDDATNHATNIDATPTKSTVLRGGLGADVFAATGEDKPALTSTPNLVQQAYLLSTATQVLIPGLKDSGKPFVLLFWSRDPDATQHGAIDSEGRLIPGINGTNAMQAIGNADNDLKGLLAALEQYGLLANTDVFVTADHGFSTILKGIPTADGQATPASLPQGFLAFDIADWLGGQKVFDPDRSNTEVDRDSGDRPQQGSALIGANPDAPIAIVAANGGTDFIYTPGANGRATARTIFARLAGAPYVGALFVNDALLKEHPADFAGALPMSAINLIGSSTVPQPSIIVGYRSFVIKGCKLIALMCTAEIADTPLHTGQGMHGSFSRADTRNFMAAMGPDFKKGFVDPTPVSNADIAPTLAQILGFHLDGPGGLTGRSATEALVGGKAVGFLKKRLVSDSGPEGIRTVLDYQEADGRRYFDAAGVPGGTVGLTAK